MMHHHHSASLRHSNPGRSCSRTVLGFIFAIAHCSYAWTTTTPVSQLLKQYSNEVKELKSIVQSAASSSNGKLNIDDIPYNNDAYYLRYCLLSDSDDSTESDLRSKLLESLQWRMSAQGQLICNAARTAVVQATATTTTSSNGWTKNNQNDVFALAPHASKISPHITPSNCITTSFDSSNNSNRNNDNSNDLIYCVRAGAINDVALFQSVTTNEMIDFFLYVKEVHALVSDMRSLSCDRLLYTVTCNDLSNVKLIGGSNEFRKALSQASTLASTIIYPSTYTGPTLLCNLPMLVSALVQLFTPLFPEKVKQRLKFVQGPLSNVADLTEISTTTSNPSKRAEFLQQLNKILQ
jgi:hypothetical protein